MKSERADVLSRIASVEDRHLTAAGTHPLAGNGDDVRRDEKFSPRTRLLVILGLSVGLWASIGLLVSLFQ